MREAPPDVTRPDNLGPVAPSTQTFPLRGWVTGTLETSAWAPGPPDSARPSFLDPEGRPAQDSSDPSWRIVMRAAPTESPMGCKSDRRSARLALPGLLRHTLQSIVIPVPLLLID